VNSMYMRTGWLFVSLLAGAAQSATLTFVDQSGDGKVVPCGNVANLTVTSTTVIATGTGTCLNTGDAAAPTAEPNNLGTVNTGGQTTSRNLTDGALVKLPLTANSVKKVSGPNLPGASVAINGSTGDAIYLAPSADDITGDAIDSFTYTITDATGKTSPSARVDVSVNWVDVPSDGCKSGNGIVCKGATPAWPVFHEKVTHYLERDTTHVWSFVYESAASVGQIGAVLSLGEKNLKISDVAGDTKEVDWNCWRDFGEYVFYEPASGTDPYACNLTLGMQYYFNIRNVSGANSTYQLKGY
jgi:hypothetical protein